MSKILNRSLPRKWSRYTCVWGYNTWSSITRSSSASSPGYQAKIEGSPNLRSIRDQKIRITWFEAGRWVNSSITLSLLQCLSPCLFAGCLQYPWELGQTREVRLERSGDCSFTRVRGYNKSFDIREVLWINCWALETYMIGSYMLFFKSCGCLILSMYLLLSNCLMGVCTTRNDWTAVEVSVFYPGVIIHWAPTSVVWQ